MRVTPKSEFSVTGTSLSTKNLKLPVKQHHFWKKGSFR